MKFNSVVALFIATASSVQAGENGLRTLAIEDTPSTPGALGTAEHLGQCNGAKCGVWGDPHIDSCDGEIYDCQGVGLFTLMKNKAFNIQANFVNVGAEEYATIVEKGWELPLGATQTNDVIIDFLLAEEAPKFQFGFGDLSDHNGTFTGEVGCDVNKYFSKKMRGTKEMEVSKVEDCRELCDNQDGCIGFSYYPSGHCQLGDKKQKYKDVTNDNWPRIVSGLMDTNCGKHVAEPELEFSDERMKHGLIGRQCPLLMYENDELQDISLRMGDDYLFKSDSGNTTVELIRVTRTNHILEITYTLPNGPKSVIHLKARGYGPGRLWSCHWDFYVCLPEDNAGEFNNTIGLLGTPDGNTTNEWMDGDNAVLEMFVDQDNAKRHAKMMDYCLSNWCVDEQDNMMAFHGDTTFEDYACKANPNATISNHTCVINVEAISVACAGYPDNAKYACEIDCCMGGCAEIDEPLDDLKTNNSTKAPAAAPIGEACEELTGTSDQVCPSTPGGVVKLLHTVGTTAIPDGSDVFHSIVQDSDSDSGDTTVRFKVNNPFDFTTHVYVKHDVSVLTTFTNSVCDGYEMAGCGASDEIEVVCKKFPGVEPFALVNVYFSSFAFDFDDNAELDECCNSEEEPDKNRVAYTFQIECTCPDDNTQ